MGVEELEKKMKMRVLKENKMGVEEFGKKMKMGVLNLIKG